MKLFTRKTEKLTQLHETPFKKEREIQHTTEQNLKTIFNLEFVKTEFSLNNLRIDTLAYNPETNAFTIIEYKKTQNYSVIDQGYAYLNLLLNNKADFILEYNQTKNKNLGKHDIDWTQSRVIFISPQFTRYQQQAINFQDLPFEIWEIHQYENNTIIYNQIETNPEAASINTITKTNTIAQKISKEIKVYREQDHTQKTTEELREKYQELKERIQNLGPDITTQANKLYMVFKTENSNIVAVVFQRSQLKLTLALPKGTLNDPYNHTRDISGVGHWASGDYELTIKPKTDLDEIMPLIKQAYQKNK
jgi:predicted transport protein